MIHTQKRHWQNGYQIRGGYFNTYTVSIFNIGIMISWLTGELPQNVKKGLRIKLYKLI